MSGQGDSQASTSENLKGHLTFLVSKRMHVLCTAGWKISFKTFPHDFLWDSGCFLLFLWLFIVGLLCDEENWLLRAIISSLCMSGEDVWLIGWSEEGVSCRLLVWWWWCGARGEPADQLNAATWWSHSEIGLLIGNSRSGAALTLYWHVRSVR